MLAYFFVLIAVASRFLPHPFSFTPVGAALLLFGARAQRKHVWFPLALLAGSDVVLTKLVYHCRSGQYVLDRTGRPLFGDWVLSHAEPDDFLLIPTPKTSCSPRAEEVT